MIFTTMLVLFQREEKYTWSLQRQKNPNGRPFQTSFESTSILSKRNNLNDKGCSEAGTIKGAAKPAIASLLQSWRPAGRVAELGTLIWLRFCQQAKLGCGEDSSPPARGVDRGQESGTDPSG
jgi:hypothetical protein